MTILHLFDLLALICSYSLITRHTYITFIFPFFWWGGLKLLLHTPLKLAPLLSWIHLIVGHIDLTALTLLDET